MFCKLLIYLLFFVFFLQITDTPTFPYRYIYIKRWLRVNQYSISEYRFFVSSWCLSYSKSVWLDIVLVGTRRWAGSKDSESHSFNHGFLKKTFLPNSFRSFTKRWPDTFSRWTLASLHHTWSSDIWFTTETLNKNVPIQKSIQGILGTPKSVKNSNKVLFLLKSRKKQPSTSLLDLKLLANTSVIGKVHTGLNKRRGICLTGTSTWMVFLNRKSNPNCPREWFLLNISPKKRNDLIEPTNTYLLTFGMPSLPTNIKVGLYQMKIDTHVCLYQTRYVA